MFGFVFGGICLALLAGAVRRHFRQGHWMRGAWQRRPGGWRRYALYSLFERLDATPGQEKVIAGAMDELRGTLRDLRETFANARREAGAALRQPELTEEDSNRVFSRFDAHLDRMREAVTAAMQKIHAALDERQRAVLADLIERGPASAMASPGGCGGRGSRHGHQPGFGASDGFIA